MGSTTVQKIQPMGSLRFSLPLSISPLPLSPTLWVIYERTLPLLVLLASVEKEKEGLVPLEFMSRFKDISYFFTLSALLSEFTVGRTRRRDTRRWAKVPGCS